MSNAYTELSDEELAKALNAAIRRHDSLIDSRPMGDEDIYFIGKRIDAMEAEQRRRKES